MNNVEKFIKITQKTISIKCEDLGDGTIGPVNPWTVGIGLSGNHGDADQMNHIAVIRFLNSESKFHVELTNYLNQKDDYNGDAEMVSIYCYGEDESKRLLESLETAVFLLRSKLREKDAGQNEMLGSGFSEIKVQL